ncbi:MAG: DUF447 family protein [Planctomycetota bacterium]|nr:DUF447 family protein [Planctomycetota bacterium]
MILEGIVTTLDPSGEVNISPMGPHVESETFEQFELKPFNTSQTYRNLKSHREGVLHVVDDVWLLARAAVGKVDAPTFAAKKVNGRVLENACHYYEFTVREMDESAERTNIQAEVVHKGTIRPFFGLNRAKHAVVEAAILATRISFLPLDEIRADYDRLAVLVQKTGGPDECRAFDFLSSFIASKFQFDPESPDQACR